MNWFAWLWIIVAVVAWWPVYQVAINDLTSEGDSAGSFVVKEPERIDQIGMAFFATCMVGLWPFLLGLALIIAPVVLVSRTLWLRGLLPILTRTHPAYARKMNAQKSLDVRGRRL